MPSFATSTVVHDNADTVHFELHARCICVVGTPSDGIYGVSDSLPMASGLDVILQSDLVISLSGILNGAPHEGRDMQTSVISQHLLDYFHANSENLGIRPSSGIFLDEEDGNAKCAETLSVGTKCSAVTAGLDDLPHASDISLIRAYMRDFPTSDVESNATNAGGAIATLSPIHNRPPLHLHSTTDAWHDRCFRSRKPLFDYCFPPARCRIRSLGGKTCRFSGKRFDAEATLFSKLSRAVLDIIHRSPHTAFRKKSRRAIKALHKSEAEATSASAVWLRTTSDDMIATRPFAEDTEDARIGVFDSFEYGDTLSRALERIYKTTSKTLRYKGLYSTSLARSSGETVDCQLVLSECLDDSMMTQNVDEDMLLGLGPDARVPVELWFDEDTETVGQSQADSDLFYDDNPNLKDIDIWVSDKAEFPPSTPLEDSDDIWGSSQSTTLDDPMLDWADEPSFDSFRTSYTPGPDVPFPDIRQRQDASWDTAVGDDEDDDDEWPDSSAHSADQTNRNFDEAVVHSSPPPAAFPLSKSMSLDVDLAHTLHPSTRLSGSGSSTSSHLPTQAQTFTPFDEALALDETTSYFPLLIDDDLEPYEVGSSRSSLPAHSQPTLLPLSAGAQHDVPYAQVI